MDNPMNTNRGGEHAQAHSGDGFHRSAPSHPDCPGSVGQGKIGSHQVDERSDRAAQVDSGIAAALDVVARARLQQEWDDA